MTAVSEPVPAPVRPTVVRLLVLVLVAALVVKSDAYAQ